jgi:hypothetical protein
MEDRHPDFFLSYDRFNSELYVRLNRHGPYNDTHYYPTQRDMKLFVNSLHDYGINILYGLWIHENRWILRRHPETLLTNRAGQQLHNSNLSADFNPLVELKADSDYGIKNGDKFVDYACKQYSKLAEDFGFNGLFIGDGGMGFRIFGDDNIGLNCYDYSKSSIIKFIDSEFFSTNDSSHNQSSQCVLNSKETKTYLASEENLVRSTSHNAISTDIWLHHKEEWIKWNCLEWSGFYQALAHHVHLRNAKLGAYSCMNYGPKKAVMHGIEYKSIATSGLDYLIFQAYDYAWGRHFKLDAKDTEANVQELYSLHLHLSSSRSSRQQMKIFVTAETQDNIENWQCPDVLSLDEIKTYVFTKSRTDRYYQSNINESIINYNTEGSVSQSIIDGIFIVWINETKPNTISAIKNTIRSDPNCA